MLGIDCDYRFVINHSFENVMRMKKGDTLNGPIEKHFNIPWKIRISCDASCKGYYVSSSTCRYLKVFLECVMPSGDEDWSVYAHIDGEVVGNADTSDHNTYSITFGKEKMFTYYADYQWSNLAALLNGGRFEFEFNVTIEKATGVNLGPLRIFDGESAREDSDVTLIVGGQKFHVLRKYLATHSSYFKVLFYGNFSESQKSEIELKDIDPDDFQMFLDLIYAESSIEAHSVLKLLHLADFFDSKTVIRRCQQFLMMKSELPLKQKFEVAIKYNLVALKTKCISEMKTVDDLRGIVLENMENFDSTVLRDLCKKSMSFLN